MSAAGIRVPPPNQRVSKVVPFPFQTCVSPKFVILRLSAAAAT